VVALRRVVLILVKSTAQPWFGDPAVYARNKKDAAVTPRAPAKGEWRKPPNIGDLVGAG